MRSPTGPAPTCRPNERTAAPIVAIATAARSSGGYTRDESPITASRRIAKPGKSVCSTG